jgi:tRNA-dihydrouridine synthase B
LAVSLAATNLTPPVLLAPMAGITDLPFRRLVASFGAGLVVSEMVASEDMVNAKPSVRARAELGLGDAATAVQLAGREAHWMAEAARIVAGQGARIIDINMGCPAKKVVGGLSGSALMRDLDHALRLIEAVVAAVDVPVTLKTRLGWDDDALNASELARRAESRGHRDDHDPRTHPVPVLQGPRRLGRHPRGDRDRDDPRHRQWRHPLRHGREGRAGGFRRRWGHGRAAARRGGPGRWRRSRRRSSAPRPRCAQGADLTAMIARHYEDMLSFYGRVLGPRVARKHLGWYMDGAGTPRGLAQGHPDGG